jgi:hypothetical protein
VNAPPQPGGIVSTRPELTEVALDGPLKNMAQAWSIAQVLAQSSMVPHALRGSPQNALVTMMLGQELGLTWTQATRGIYVLPNGTPGLRGQLLLALIRKAGHRYTFERDDNSCKCTITRKDEDFKVPYEGTFTLDDALAAGLVSKKDGKLFARSSSGNPLPWEQYRRDMLQWRAVARAAGVGAPEVIYGFDIAGIGDSAETAAGAAPAGPAPAPAGAATWQAEVVDVKEKLAGLDQQAQATAEHMGGWQDGKETHPGEAQPEAEEMPFPEDPGVAGSPAQAEPERRRAAPPGYDDLDQLLKRCGFHGPAQSDLVSALVHRDVSGLSDLSKGEVLIAHDVITRAVKGATTVGARRASLAQLAAAERDVLQSQDEESTWLSKD